MFVFKNGSGQRGNKNNVNKTKKKKNEWRVCFYIQVWTSKEWIPRSSWGVSGGPFRFMKSVWCGSGCVSILYCLMILVFTHQWFTWNQKTIEINQFYIIAVWDQVWWNSEVDFSILNCKLTFLFFHETETEKQREKKRIQTKEWNLHEQQQGCNKLIKSHQNKRLQNVSFKCVMVYY